MLVTSFLIEMCKRDMNFISIEYQIATPIDSIKVTDMAADIRAKGDAAGIDILVIYVEPIVMIRFSPRQ